MPGALPGGLLAPRQWYQPPQVGWRHDLRRTPRHTQLLRLLERGLQLLSLVRANRAGIVQCLDARLKVIEAIVFLAVPVVVLLTFMCRRRHMPVRRKLWRTASEIAIALSSLLMTE